MSLMISATLRLSTSRSATTRCPIALSASILFQHGGLDLFSAVHREQSHAAEPRYILPESPPGEY